MKSQTRKPIQGFWGWIYTRWYFWLIVIFWSLWSLIGEDFSNPNFVWGYFFGSALAVFIVLHIPFGIVWLIKTVSKIKDRLKV